MKKLHSSAPTNVSEITRVVAGAPSIPRKQNQFDQSDSASGTILAPEVKVHRLR